MHSTPLQLIVCDNDGCLMPEQPGILDADHFRPIAEHNRKAMVPAAASRR